MCFLKVRREYVLIVRTLCVIVGISILCFDLVMTCTLVDEWHYAQNHEKKVEGMVTNFVSEINGAESFSVEGVHFSYPINDNIIGYNLTARDRGSVIRGDEQYLRLTYYNRDNVNIITKIECEVNELDSDAKWNLSRGIFCREVCAQNIRLDSRKGDTTIRI